MKYVFEKIFLNRESRKDEIAKRVIKNLKLPVVEVGDVADVSDHVHQNYPDPIAGGKRIIYLARNKGEKIKECPCTKNKVSCGYYIINLYTGCPIDCSYCILQKYLNNPFITVYTNLEDYFEEIAIFLKNDPGKILRIGTGELADSLALDGVTSLSLDFIDFFKDHDNAVFELKTKSVEIENLLKIEPPQNVVVSWSLNPQGIVEREEMLSASLSERLNASKRCADKGYKVGFHFDPIIIYPRFENEYREVVDMIFDHVSPENISWISLGALRFEPSLKPVVMERFPDSLVNFGEFTLGSDNKLRYIRKVRVGAFKILSERIKMHSKDIHVYLCMESEEMALNTVMG